jgi:hypothetical protein
MLFLKRFYIIIAVYMSEKISAVAKEPSIELKKIFKDHVFCFSGKRESK